MISELLGGVMLMGMISGIFGFFLGRAIYEHKQPEQTRWIDCDNSDIHCVSCAKFVK